MQLVVQTHALFPLALASAHAATDFAKPPRMLAPYLLLVAWPSAVPVTPAFFAASIVHFGRDVGVEVSAYMHAAWLLVAAIDAETAFSLFTLYYCLVHGPLHCARHASHWRLPAAAALLCIAVFAATTPPPTLSVEEWMQRLVVSHVACEELEAYCKR